MMEALFAAALVVAFWGLLWLGAIWAGPDTRDGADWSNRGRSRVARRARSTELERR